MKTGLSSYVCLFSILAVIFLSFPAASQTLTYTETFSSEVYKDTGVTTAWWDISAGELKLYPYEITSLATYNTPTRMSFGGVVSGNYYYVADNSAGGSMVYAFDITNPSSLPIAGSLFVVGEARDLDVSGNYLYLANYAEGLTVIDITDPAAIRIDT